MFLSLSLSLSRSSWMHCVEKRDMQCVCWCADLHAYAALSLKLTTTRRPVHDACPRVSESGRVQALPNKPRA